MLSVAPKQTLVSALCSWVGEHKRRRARRFLQGLSVDELQYIAEFLGSCILEASSGCQCTRHQLAEGIERFESCRAQRLGFARDWQVEVLENQEHKMILLLEYLCHCGLTNCSIAARMGQA